MMTGALVRGIGCCWPYPPRPGPGAVHASAGRDNREFQEAVTVRGEGAGDSNPLGRYRGIRPRNHLDHFHQ